MYNSDNIFARILKCEIPCNKVDEDPYFLAFHDIQPKAPIHVLVIPKGSYEDAQDFNSRATSDEIIGFYKGVAKVVDKLNIKDHGFRLICNTGLNGGQEVPHYHVHILGGKKLGPMLGNTTGST